MAVPDALSRGIVGMKWNREMRPLRDPEVVRRRVALLALSLAALLAAASTLAARLADDVPTWHLAEMSPALEADPFIVVGGRAAAAFMPVNGTTIATSTKNDRWFRLDFDADWSGNEPLVFSIAGASNSQVWLYAPPDYHAQGLWQAKPNSQGVFSRRAIAFVLPSNLLAAHPVYFRLGATLTPKRPQVSITQLAKYQASDLRHVRISTLFSSMQFTMVLVAACLWLALRDRILIYFVGYAGLQLIGQLLVSGEFYDLPGAQLLAPLGPKGAWLFATLSAPLSLSFALAFCDLRRITPQLALVLRALRWPFLAAASLMLLPIPAIARVLPPVVNLLFMISALAMIGTVGVAAWRRNRAARFFIIAWMPQVVFIVMRVIQLGLQLPEPTWLQYGVPFSMAFSTIIVTLGLADATLHARRERDLAHRIAEMDGLTGVLNRRAIMQRVADAVTQSRIHQLPLSLLFLDLDHFKDINDRHGHLAGDRCLMAFTDAIRHELGAGQDVGRYGGEEFLVILPGASRAEALAVSEHLRRKVENLSIDSDGQALTLTTSIGVASLIEGRDTPDQLMHRADRALYRAKAAGRNRVAIHAPHMPVEA